MTLDKRAEILELIKIGENQYDWKKVKRIWISAEKDSKKNLFSKIGIGANTVTIYMRKTGLSLHHVIKIKERILFLSHIEEYNPLLLKILAVDILPSDITAKLITTYTNEEKEIEGEERKIFFPAIITEKYLGYEQQAPMAVTEKTFVIVVPKTVEELEESDLVYLPNNPEDKPYIVKMCHTLDEFKNEYEVSRRLDI